VIFREDHDRVRFIQTLHECCGKAAEQKAERIVREELRELDWTIKDLRKSRKGAPEKVAIALRLRRETTISLKWIAERLQMGCLTHAANRIYEKRSHRSVNV
jgi:hypothetical protein